MCVCVYMYMCMCMCMCMCICMYIYKLIYLNIGESIKETVQKKKKQENIKNKNIDFY
jgi:Ca2+-dependent lipid-binding protein